jgi:hypothetical protein
MSFRLFIYYCALCGGAAAFVGWIVGRVHNAEQEPLRSGLRGLWLGLAVTLALGLIDTLWNDGLNRPFTGLLRTLTAILIGTLGGFVGGVAAQWIYARAPWLSVLCWGFVGLLIGAALGVFDVGAAALAHKDTGTPLRKLRNVVLGGSLGGLLGGALQLAVAGLFLRFVQDARVRALLWSPSADGFVALGACIGLMISLAQVILTEAWIKVEKGFRAGRDILLKPEVTIGKAEGCDVGLFGDPQVERLHARIRKHGEHYVLSDAGSATGTFVNDAPIHGPVVLRSGDQIRVGRAVLRFGERQKSVSSQ